MASSVAGSAAVRPWRVAAFAASLGLTLSAVVASSVGLVSAAPVAAVGVDRGVGTEVDEQRADPRSSARAGDSDDSAFWPGHVWARAAERLRRTTPAAVPALPPRSGDGRRVVFDQSAQQVWLVRDGGTVRRTYPVSGSKIDNLGPGSYEVYSRSRDAIGYDYRTTMRYMVRFTQGRNAAIGFHDLPLDEAGRRVQTAAQLGVARSSGCIRQRPADARQMWDFASLGTDVVVIA